MSNNNDSNYNSFNNFNEYEDHIDSIINQFKTQLQSIKKTRREITSDDEEALDSKRDNENYRTFDRSQVINREDSSKYPMGMKGTSEFEKPQSHEKPENFSYSFYRNIDDKTIANEGKDKLLLTPSNSEEYKGNAKNVTENNEYKYPKEYTYKYPTELLKEENISIKSGKSGQSIAYSEYMQRDSIKDKDNVFKSNSSVEVLESNAKVNGSEINRTGKISKQESSFSQNSQIVFSKTKDTLNFPMTKSVSTNKETSDIISKIPSSNKYSERIDRNQNEIQNNQINQQKFKTESHTKTTIEAETKNEPEETFSYLKNLNFSYVNNKIAPNKRSYRNEDRNFNVENQNLRNKEIKEERLITNESAKSQKDFNEITFRSLENENNESKNDHSNTKNSPKAPKPSKEQKNFESGKEKSITKEPPDTHKERTTSNQKYGQRISNEDSTHNEIANEINHLRLKLSNYEKDIEILKKQLKVKTEENYQYEYKNETLETSLKKAKQDLQDYIAKSESHKSNNITQSHEHELKTLKEKLDNMHEFYEARRIDYERNIERLEGSLKEINSDCNFKDNIIESFLKFINKYAEYIKPEDSTEKIETKDIEEIVAKIDDFFEKLISDLFLLKEQFDSQKLQREKEKKKVEMVDKFVHAVNEQDESVQKKLNDKIQDLKVENNMLKNQIEKLLEKEKKIKSKKKEKEKGKSSHKINPTKKIKPEASSSTTNVKKISKKDDNEPKKNTLGIQSYNINDSNINNSHQGLRRALSPPSSKVNLKQYESLEADYENYRKMKVGFQKQGGISSHAKEDLSLNRNPSDKGLSLNDFAKDINQIETLKQKIRHLEGRLNDPNLNDKSPNSNTSFESNNDFKRNFNTIATGVLGGMSRERNSSKTK